MEHDNNILPGLQLVKSAAKKSSTSTKNIFYTTSKKLNHKKLIENVDKVFKAYLILQRPCQRLFPGAYEKFVCEKGNRGYFEWA